VVERNEKRPPSRLPLSCAPPLPQTLDRLVGAKRTGSDQASLHARTAASLFAQCPSLSHWLLARVLRPWVLAPAPAVITAGLGNPRELFAMPLPSTGEASSLGGGLAALSAALVMLGNLVPAQSTEPAAVTGPEMMVGPPAARATGEEMARATEPTGETVVEQVAIALLRCGQSIPDWRVCLCLLAGGRAGNGKEESAITTRNPSTRRSARHHSWEGRRGEGKREVEAEVSTKANGLRVRATGSEAALYQYSATSDV